MKLPGGAPAVEPSNGGIDIFDKSNCCGAGLCPNSGVTSALEPSNCGTDKFDKSKSWFAGLTEAKGSVI